MSKRSGTARWSGAPRHVAVDLTMGEGTSVSKRRHTLFLRERVHDEETNCRGWRGGLQLSTCVLVDVLLVF